MTRKEFIKLCGVLGVSLPFTSAVSTCNDNNDQDPIESNEDVLIVGAGPAGMSVGHLLAQRGINFQILEASSTYGGRIRQNLTFTDFPISLGGEWIHVANTILSEIVNDSSVNITTRTEGYNNSDLIQNWDGSSLAETTIGAIGGIEDLKFVGSSWLDFFETYVLPNVQAKIAFNKAVTAIDYSTDPIRVTVSGGETFTADRVIVTVPVKILQTGTINFTPALPNDKQQAINEVVVWGGFKAFFKFSEKFYGAYLELPDSETAAGQRIYYDAAYAQTSSDNILGLFSVGQQAERYQGLSGNDQRDYILNELDTIFGGNTASNRYVDHIVQNWNDEPYARAAYVRDQEDWQLVRTLGQSVNNRLYFAGDAYTDGSDWSSVHTAVRSARQVVEELIG